MWILILAVYASPYASSNFASVHTQEFDTENMCHNSPLNCLSGNLKLSRISTPKRFALRSKLIPTRYNHET